MNHPHSKIIKLTASFFAFLITLSCSKDNDLLADATVIDAKEESLVVQNYLVNDSFETAPGASIVLDVLANDVFENPDQVKIIEVSTPTNGEIIIIENKTIMYIPNAANTETENSSVEEEAVSEGESTSAEENTEVEEEIAQEPAPEEDTAAPEESPATEEAVVEEEPESTEEVTDTFTYTVEIENEDETTTTEEASVTVTQTEDPEPPQQSFSTPEDILYWKNLFDSNYGTFSSHMYELANSRNKNQEYYYLAYYVDALVSVWQATGDNSYLDTVLGVINQTMNHAVDVGGGYRGWPAADGGQYGLWDSFYWRFVATLTRVLYESPNLRNSGYESNYEQLLYFSEQHIWNRYESQGQANFYRINTHMASHWARIGMELYKITGKNKYKEVFDNISFGTMPGRPSNLRGQLRQNYSVSSAYTWSSEWGGGAVQDVSHAGAIISFWVAAYDNGMYWNYNDIEALKSTLKNVVWPDYLGNKFTVNVDGSGGEGLHGRLHEWLHLGRYSGTIQNKIRNNYLDGNLSYYGIEALGIAALNARYLNDGKPVYPEY